MRFRPVSEISTWCPDICDLDEQSGQENGEIEADHSEDENSDDESGEGDRLQASRYIVQLHCERRQ
ncbi:hypothetical protein Tco_0301253, partial [Tanacetum coccineum]